MARKWSYGVSVVIIIGLLFITGLQISGPFITNQRIVTTIPHAVTYTKNETEKLQLVDALPKWDFKQLINFDHFTFHLMNAVCTEIASLLLLVVVISEPCNRVLRQAIRETWGHKYSKHSRIVFFVGMTDILEYQGSLLEEAEEFNDIVQGNFYDNATNLSYKHVMALKYAVHYCNQAEFILKVQDDILVNIDVFTNYLLLRKTRCGVNGLLQCHYVQRNVVVRSGPNWELTFQDYPNKFFPTYCIGTAVLYTWDVTYKLYREAQKGDLFPIDDVYVSGILAKRINMKHTPWKGLEMSEEQIKMMLETLGAQGPKTFVFAPVRKTAQTMYDLWAILQNDKHLKRYTPELQEKCENNHNKTFE